MVLLTGGTGFVGGHMLVHLIQAGRKVRALKRKNSSTRELEIICRFYGEDFQSISSHIEWIEGDLLNPESLDNALINVQEVYHCAAVVSFDGKDPEQLNRINIEGTRNLVNATIHTDISNFIYISSIGALGESLSDKLITEATSWNLQNQSSAYSNSKYHAEQEVWAGIEKSLNVIIVNPGIILGAGDFTKGSLRFFSQVKRGMPFYTDQQTGYVDVRDVCKAILVLKEKQLFNMRFILVSENLTNKQLFTYIANALNKKPPFIRIGKTGLRIASMLNRLGCKISGKQPLLSREIVNSASGKHRYSSDKFLSNTGFSFTPMKKCIEDAVNGFNGNRND